MTYLEELFSLKGKTAVVIGGTGVLCGEMAQGLGSAGAEVVVVGRSEERGAERVKAITDAGGQAWFQSCDTTDTNSLTALKDAVLERSGKIDILVNGAGANSATPFFEVTEEEFDRLLNINVKSLYQSCQIFGKVMVEAKSGSVINIGSMSGLRPLSRVFTYSLTKAAVHNLSLNLAREWGASGVRVNTLVPGFFPAEQNRKVLDQSRIKTILSHTPMDRFGEANELIGATLLLASDKAGSFINGHELIVDGGFNAMSI